MTSLDVEIAAKRRIMRGIYGGMMSLSDLAKELGVTVQFTQYVRFCVK